MIAVICVFIWLIGIAILMAICGLSFEKEKNQPIPIKKLTIVVLLGSPFTFFLYIMYEEYYDLLCNFFMAIGLIGIVVYTFCIAFLKK